MSVPALYVPIGLGALYCVMADPPLYVPNGFGALLPTICALSPAHIMAAI